MGNQLTIDQFKSLAEYQQKQFLDNDHKVAEHYDDVAKYEFFRVSNFYVEVKISFAKRYRVITNTYTIQNIPLVYAGKIHASL